MPFMPFQILGIWFRGLLSIAILAGGIYLLRRWYDDSHVVEPVRVVAADAGPDRADAAAPAPDRARGEVPAASPAPAGRRVFRFEPGWNRETGLLAAAIALLLWATVGRWIGHGVSTLWMKSGSDPGPAASASAGKGGSGDRASGKRKSGKRKSVKSTPARPEADEDPRPDRTGEVHTITRPDGSILRVECYGPVDAPPIVWTHGWGCDSTEWFYQKKHLAGRFRLIVWDEPGLGLSKKPDNNDYRLEKLAADLEAVLALAGGRPAILAGHSIGGMIILTFCKLFPEALGTRVCGLILAHTSYTNPVRTTQMAALYTAIEKPVLIPLMYLTIGTWPLVMVMNIMSYLNGSAHQSTHKTSFSGNETRGQLDFVTRYMPFDRPDVLARGMLGMIAYDATGVLPGINVPTLVVVGDKDTTTLPEAGQFIAANVPRADLATLSPARHMGLFEHHDRFDRLVSDFAAASQAARAPR